MYFFRYLEGIVNMRDWWPQFFSLYDYWSSNPSNSLYSLFLYIIFCRIIWSQKISKSSLLCGEWPSSFWCLSAIVVFSFGSSGFYRLSMMSLTLWKSISWSSARDDWTERSLSLRLCNCWEMCYYERDYSKNY